MTRVVLLRLGSDLAVVGVATDSPGKLLAFGSAYDEIVLGRDAFLGFYDWLRTPAGAVVGLRLSIDTARPDLPAMIPDAPYVVRETSEVLRIMFARAESIDEEASMDQDFGRSRVFRNSAGEIALTFDAESLTPEEFDQVGSEHDVR